MLSAAEICFNCVVAKNNHILEKRRRILAFYPESNPNSENVDHCRCEPRIEQYYNYQTAAFQKQQTFAFGSGQRSSEADIKNHCLYCDKPTHGFIRTCTQVFFDGKALSLVFGLKKLPSLSLKSCFERVSNVFEDTVPKDLYEYHDLGPMFEKYIHRVPELFMHAQTWLHALCKVEEMLDEIEQTIIQYKSTELKVREILQENQRAHKARLAGSKTELYEGPVAAIPVFSLELPEQMDLLGQKTKHLFLQGQDFQFDCQGWSGPSRFGPSPEGS